MRDGWFKASSVRQGERGAVLLLALILTTTFALLAWSLLASSDFAARARLGGAAQEQAERAAASGIEWAAAVALAGSLVDGSTSMTLADGSQIAVVVAMASSPQVVARARCRGAEVAFCADLRPGSGAPLPYALATFGRSTELILNATVNGSVYLSGSPTFRFGLGRLSLAGDLFVTASAIDGSRLLQTSGTTRTSFPALPEPVIDLSPFAEMRSGAVPVTRYSRSTTLRNLSLTGIVVVDLEVGQTLRLQDTTIDGTLVVRKFAFGRLGQANGLMSLGLPPAYVRLHGASKIRGGTAWTGNLALLAPACDVAIGDPKNMTLSGVLLAYSTSQLRNLVIEGQLVVLDQLSALHGLVVTRPRDFVPDTPLGITWPGTQAVRIDWRGRQ